MCYCWRMTRKDGEVLAFTDHDENITFDTVTYIAETGFTASAAQQSLGMAVDNLELIGAFNSAAITESDMVAGLYDDADLLIHWVNWVDPSQRIISLSGSLGEITQTGIQFTAELRSLAHRLGQTLGHVHTRTCRVSRFANAACGLDPLLYTFSAVVTSVASRNQFFAVGLAQDSGYFDRGVVTWLTGDNAGSTVDVRAHYYDGTAAADIGVYSPAGFDIQIGDAFTIIAGCDQAFSTCVGFGNAVNFRAEPHMPGKDFTTLFADADTSEKIEAAYVK